MVQSVTILLFGPAADAAGASELSFDIKSDATVGDLTESLKAFCPALEPFVNAGRIAVNQAFATETTPIKPEDELALIAMVSGG